jgi:hypothetical protein
MEITVFRHFSFGASKVVPVGDMKACEKVHISSILNTENECRRCVTLSDQTSNSPMFWENPLSLFYPEI